MSEQRRCCLLNEAFAAEQFDAILRGHCGIENRLHWVMDVTGQEDQARNRNGRCAENLALNLARLESSEVSMRGKPKRAS